MEQGVIDNMIIFLPRHARRGGCGRQAAQVPAGRAGRQGLEAAQGLPPSWWASWSSSTASGGSSRRRRAWSPRRHLRPLLHEPRQVQEHERLRGPGQVRAGRGQELRDELRAPDQRRVLGARTLQLSKLMMEKAYYLHMRRLFPKMRLLFTDTDSVMVQIFELQDPLHAMAEANLNGAALFNVAASPRTPRGT